MSLNTIHDVLKYTCKLGLRFALAGHLGLWLPALCCHLRGVLPYSQLPFLWGLWLFSPCWWEQFIWSILQSWLQLPRLRLLWKTYIETFPVLWCFVSFFSRAKNVNLCRAMKSFRGAAKLMSTNLPFFLHSISKFVEVINVMRTTALTRKSANQSYKCAAFMWFSALLQSVLKGPYRCGLGQQTAVHTQAVISSTSLPVCFGKVHLQFVSWVSPGCPMASWYPYALEKKN